MFKWLFKFKELLNIDFREITFRDFLEWFGLYQLYLYIVCVFCVSLIIYNIQVKPNVNNYFEKASIFKEYNTLFKSKQKRVMNKEGVDREISRLSILVDERQAIFFSENDFNEFSINILPKIAIAYNNKIKSVVYKNTIKKEGFLIYKLNFSVEGNFNGLLNLYNDLEHFSKVIKIDQFSIVLRKLNPLVLSTDVSLSLYGVSK